VKLKGQYKDRGGGGTKERDLGASFS
jgi:hypothetical protein